MALNRSARLYTHFGLGPNDTVTTLRKLVTAQGDARTSTQFAKANGAAVLVTFVPETTGEQGQDPQNFQSRGWGYSPGEFSAPDERGRVLMPAGVFHWYVEFTISNSNVLVASTTVVMRPTAWKYNVVTKTAVRIGNLPTGASTTASANQNIPITLAEDVIFEPNEVLVIQLGMTMTVAPGALNSANTGTVVVNTGSGTGLRYEANGPSEAKPVIRYVEPAAEVVAAGIGALRTFIRKEFEAGGNGGGSFERAAEHFRLHEAVAVGDAAKDKIVIFKSFVAKAAGTAIDGVTTVIKKGVLVSVVGVGRRSSTVCKQLETLARGDGELQRLQELVRDFQAEAVGVPDDLRRVVIFVRLMEAVATMSIRPRISLPWDDLPDPGQGGGSTVVRRPIYLMDD